MNGSTAVVGVACFVLGVGGGIILGAGIMRRKYNEEMEARHQHEKEKAEQKKQDEKVGQSIDIVPIKTSTASQTVSNIKTEKDYKQYNKLIEEYGPEAEDVTEEVKEWEEEHAGEVKVVPVQLYDPDYYPTGPRNINQLYFFQSDHILCTETGEILLDTDSKYHIFFHSEFVDSDEPETYICDGVNEEDYIVTRITDETYESWYPSEED